MKIPHDPSLFVGLWAVGLNSRIGRITEATRDPSGPLYRGVGLNGDPWWTRTPIVLDDRDQRWLNKENQDETDL